MLSDIEIKEAIKSDEIAITPFSDEFIQPASYDLRIGQALLSGQGVIDLTERELIIRTGDWAEIETLEAIKLSKKIGATIGACSSITRQGLVWFSGSHIDPGYEGRLFIGIFNPSSESIRLKHGEKFCSMQFHKLGKDASFGYDGKFQKMMHFPAEDVARISKLSAPSLGDVIKSVGILENTVVDLDKNINTLNTILKVIGTDVSWIKKLFFSIVIALIMGVVIGAIFLFITFNLSPS